MIADTVTARLKALASELEPRLANAVAEAGDVPAELRAAMDYALLGGGKRLRPALVISACRLVGGDDVLAWPGACAVEMIHTYSLVHDDLPCMDDDDLRHGRPTVHKVFGDAMAVLVGDGLQALAFETLVRGVGEPARAAAAVQLLAAGAGAAGMVGGQVLDLAGEGAEPDLALVRAIHAKKTAALLTASVEIGGVLGGAGANEQAALRGYGRALGLAFQIVDDCLDETATAAELGKSAGKDRAAGKATWPACVGVKASLEAARALVAEARAALASIEGLEMEARFLDDLAWFVVDRTR